MRVEEEHTPPESTPLTDLTDEREQAGTGPPVAAFLAPRGPHLAQGASFGIGASKETKAGPLAAHAATRATADPVSVPRASPRPPEGGRQRQHSQAAVAASQGGGR
jgi:hypothetical protein